MVSFARDGSTFTVLCVGIGAAANFPYLRGRQTSRLRVRVVIAVRMAIIYWFPGCRTLASARGLLGGVECYMPALLWRVAVALGIIALSELRLMACRSKEIVEGILTHLCTLACISPANHGPDREGANALA